LKKGRVQKKAPTGDAGGAFARMLAVKVFFELN